MMQVRDLVAEFGGAPCSANLSDQRRRVVDPRRLRLIARGLARDRRQDPPLKARHLAVHMAAAEENGTRLSPIEVSNRLTVVVLAFFGVSSIAAGLVVWLGG